MFSVLGVINLTYGFYFSAGAFVALYATKYLAMPIWAALPFAAVATGLVAILIDELLLGPLRRAKASRNWLADGHARRDAAAPLFADDGLVHDGYPPLPAGRFRRRGLPVRRPAGHAVADPDPSSPWRRSSAASRCCCARPRSALPFARSPRADAAQLTGINAGGVVHLVSFISGALGGAAGVLIGLNCNAIQPYMGEMMMLRGFAVIIVGGLGDIRGAVLAGFVLGLLESLTAGYVASSMKDAVGFLLLVLTLWFRPVGLFGRVLLSPPLSPRLLSRSPAKSRLTMRALDNFLFTYQSLIHSLGVNGLLALSMYVVLAVGQLALGQAAFMGVGAYASALLTVKFGVPFPLALLASMAVPACSHS